MNDQTNDGMGIDIHPIFTGLTRPPMLLGVTVDYLFICFFVSYSLFMLSANPFFLVIYLPLHSMGWVACRVDHNCFRVMQKGLYCPAVRNKTFWRCQSYAPY